jgi:hypothetical protein
MAPSPCIDRCKILKRTGVCRGCGRTRDEIALWRRSSEAEQAAILASLPARAPLMVEDEGDGD